MSAPNPSNDIIDQLEELFVLKREDGKYTYDDEFVKSVEGLKRRGVGRIEGARLARRFSSMMTTTILSYKCFRSKNQIENLITAFTCLNFHVNRINLKLPKDPSSLVYGVWFFNDHEMSVL